MLSRSPRAMTKTIASAGSALCAASDSAMLALTIAPSATGTGSATGCAGCSVAGCSPAAIDGAGPARRFWTIVFPLLTPTTFFLLVINVVYAFFDTFGNRLQAKVTAHRDNGLYNHCVTRIFMDVRDKGTVDFKLIQRQA